MPVYSRLSHGRGRHADAHGPRRPRSRAHARALAGADAYQWSAMARPEPRDVPQLRFVELPGGHWLHEDNPQAVDAELRAFLRDCQRPEK
jgi:pimeloyl-ACP methyl ester carboxylesterase